jgi:PAS domain S-box-containing protein
MPPLLWAAVRFEFKGVAVALTLLALITMALTISGDSQFVGDSESQREKQIMLQLFLVISAFSALIVAAISRQHQQALLTLRESERKLQQLIDAVPVMIWSTTDEGQPSYVNKRFTDVTGATLNDIIGPNGSFNLKIIHPDDKAVTAEAISCSFETGAPYVIKYRQLRNDGTFRWTETRAEALRDDSGKIIQWYGASTDIDDLVNTQ